MARPGGYISCGRVPAVGRPIPARIGLAEFGELGAWVTVCCPRDLAPLTRRAGGLWEPGSHRWLIERRRIGPVIRALQRQDQCRGDPQGASPGERRQPARRT